MLTRVLERTNYNRYTGENEYEIIAISEYGFEWWVNHSRVKDGLVDNLEAEIRILKSEGFKELRRRKSGKRISNTEDAKAEIKKARARIKKKAINPIIIQWEVNKLNRKIDIGGMIFTQYSDCVDEIEKFKSECINEWLEAI